MTDGIFCEETARAGPARTALLRGFIWDGENILFQTDGPGERTTNRHYSYNPQAYGELISQSGVFHHFDGFGSTDRITNAAGTVRNRYLYQAFGQVTALEANEPNRFTWLGRIGYYEQPNTGDYWVRARVYSPTNGRWLSRDLVRALGFGGGGVPGAVASPRDPMEAVGRHRCADALARGESAATASHRGQMRGTAYIYSANQPHIKIDPGGAVLPVILIVGGAVIWVAACHIYAFFVGWPTLHQGKDKLAHCIAHCVNVRCMLPLIQMGAPLVSALSGLAVEVFQRQIDWKDVTANKVGIGCGLSLWRWSCQKCCIDRLEDLGT